MTLDHAPGRVVGWGKRHGWSGLAKLLEARRKHNPQSAEWKNAEADLKRDDESKRKRTPSDRHEKRMKAIYVEPISDTAWNRPAVTSAMAAYEFLNDAVNDYAGRYHQGYITPGDMLKHVDAECRPECAFLPSIGLSRVWDCTGEMGSWEPGESSVVSPLSTGLTVFPLSIGLLVFCASARVMVAVKISALRPISSMRFATMSDLPVGCPEPFNRR